MRTTPVSETASEASACLGVIVFSLGVVVRGTEIAYAVGHAGLESGTRSALVNTGIFATNAVDAEAADAIELRGASLTIHELARTGAVAGLSYSGTGSDIALPERHVRAHTRGTWRVARFAYTAARRIATYSVRAMTAQAFGRQRA